MMGTPSYMAPEQIEGSQVSGETDQFALAAVAYEVLTGEKPFAADYLPTLFFRIVREDPQPAMEVNPLLSPEIDLVLQRGLAKKAADRFETCTDFITALVEACEAHAGWSPPSTETTRVMGQQSIGQVRMDNPPPPTMPMNPQPPPPANEEAPVILPYDLPRSRRREWEEEPEYGLPLWRKVAIGLILCAMVAMAVFVYHNYMAAGQGGESTAQPAAAAPYGGAGQPADAASQPASGGTQAPATAPPPPSPAPGAALSPNNVPQPSGSETAQKAPARPEEAPPTRAAPVRTSVQFMSDPAQARVVVDGDESKSCHTPCSIPLPPGRHTLTMTAPSYGIARRIIQVPDQRDVFVPLAQNIGIVQMDSIPSGSTVYVDGRMMGQTPTTLKLRAGAHQIRLTNGSRSHQETIEVNADSLQQFTFRWQ
jgi:serine/threonine-protein kinase